MIFKFQNIPLNSVHGSLLFLSCMALISTTGNAETLAKWSYSGSTGPSHWSELSPNYQLCNTGKHQSPIDIGKLDVKSFGELVFEYQKTPLEIEYNGHAIEIDYEKGSTITMGNEIYQLSQIQFHSPSEHTINGKHYAMEAQLVHQNSGEQLLVVSVLMNSGDKNKTLEKIINAAPEDKAINFVPGKYINAASILPEKTDQYFAYVGSITSPPCNENVQWIVLKESVSVSIESVSRFLKIVDKNARPTQDISAHKIFVSKSN